MLPHERPLSEVDFVAFDLAQRPTVLARLLPSGQVGKDVSAGSDSGGPRGGRVLPARPILVSKIFLSKGDQSCVDSGGF
jgi:hypothetical protein